MTLAHFLSYADARFAPAARALCASALSVGFASAAFRGPDDLAPAFREAHATILSAPRGAGYWLWKPQIILQELDRIGPGEVLCYCDAGRSAYYRFPRMPERLIAKAAQHGFLLGPRIAQHGPMSRWTKRDAFILTGMDRPEIASRAPIQATWSFWTNCPPARAFLKLWLQACQDPRILTDQPSELGPNYPDFQDHRHDQAALSLIAYRDGAPCLDYSARGLFRILRLRPQSALAHHFLKRIDDAEAMERGEMIRGLVRSFRTLRAARGEARHG